MATDQFCLRWNNFQVNITTALESLKNDEDLVDVTLTCEGQNVKAHKVILAACSPYFRNVFKENPCQHPVVILKDVKYEDVTALLSFMYHGEVYITQDRLAPFLHTAELLQVRGLTGAGNPFKDFPVPPPLVQAKKGSAPPPASAPLRRETPPPAARAVRSPLVSPPPKDSTSSHEADGDPPAKAGHQVLPVPALFFTSNGQAGTLYSSLNPDQTITSAAAPPASPTTFQMLSTNSCGQLSSRFSNVSGQSVTQPSSPSPTKRRKTLPRRFSSCIVPSVPSESSFNKGERAKDPLQDSSESLEAEGVFKDVDVKVEETSGDEMLSEGDEEGTSACAQENADADGSELAIQQDDDCAERLLEQDVEVPGAPLLSPLAGKSQRDDRDMSRPCPFCFKTISNKSNLLKHMKIRHSGQCLQQQCQICSKMFKNKYSLKVHEYTYHRNPRPLL